jgi:putative flavoprotein involved in K+ transport
VTEAFNVAVIGAGQAGLATSYYLTKLERNHIILEKASELIPAWHRRWDSFTLVLPNWTLNMPGYEYSGDDPDGYMEREELIAYLENYAASFDPNIRFNSLVTSVERNPSNETFLVHTNENAIEAHNVVVAAGTYQKPKILPFSKKLSLNYTQIHTDEYRSPGDLPDGAVLVVGSGQSGCQIAEELYQSGRRVYLCVGGAKTLPRRYRGRDSIWWMRGLNIMDQKVDSLESPMKRFEPNPVLSGKDGGHSLDLHVFARDGVVLLSRLKDAQGDRIFLKTDLHENLAKVDEFVSDFKHKVDDFIIENHIEAEEEPDKPEPRDGYNAEIIEELDLNEDGINTIVWATGYRYDFSWIKLPVFDEVGYPIQTRGVSKFPGLYFVGLHWLYKRKSGIFMGVGDDAAFIAQHIACRPV